MQGNCAVQVGHFAERHFIKNFEKKYKTLWDVTFIAITAELARIDALLLTNRAETICDRAGIKIVKTEFKIAKSKESARSSCNRCVVAWEPDRQMVTMLLLYHKTDLSGKNETAEWKRLIKDNYPEYRNIL